MALPRCFRGRKSVTLRTPDLIPLNPNLVRARHRGFVRYANAKSIPEAFLIHYFTVLQIHKPRLLL